MKVLSRFALIVALFAALPAQADVSLADRALLQATMQRHIEASLVGGKFLHVDPSSGDIVGFDVDDAHPMILTHGEHFILCASFKDAKGAEVNVDFFIARRGNGFVVFNQQVDNRQVIAKLMKSGVARRVR